MEDKIKTPIGTKNKTFEIDFDKVNTIEDIKSVLKAMQIKIFWYSEEVPEQFLDIVNKKMLK